MNDLIKIERPVADTSFDGAGNEAWVLVDEVWAEIEEMRPRQAERLDGGFTVTTWRAQVRMHRRDDITGEMRFVSANRPMQIVSGPVHIERGARIEFMVEDFQPGRG